MKNIVIYKKLIATMMIGFSLCNIGKGLHSKIKPEQLNKSVKYEQMNEKSNSGIKVDDLIFKMPNIVTNSDLNYALIPDLGQSNFYINECISYCEENKIDFDFFSVLNLNNFHLDANLNYAENLKKFRDFLGQQYRLNYCDNNSNHIFYLYINNLSKLTDEQIFMILYEWSKINKEQGFIPGLICSKDTYLKLSNIYKNINKFELGFVNDEFFESSLISSLTNDSINLNNLSYDNPTDVSDFEAAATLSIGLFVTGMIFGIIICKKLKERKQRRIIKYYSDFLELTLRIDLENYSLPRNNYQYRLMLKEIRKVTGLEPEVQIIIRNDISRREYKRLSRLGILDHRGKTRILGPDENYLDYRNKRIG